MMTKEDTATKPRIAAEYHSIRVMRMKDTADGRMRVMLDVRTEPGYEQDKGESDEDFIFVIKKECLKWSHIAKRLKEASHLTKEGILRMEKKAREQAAARLRDIDTEEEEVPTSFESFSRLGLVLAPYAIILLLLLLLLQHYNQNN